jgi:hypothetical protein
MCVPSVENGHARIYHDDIGGGGTTRSCFFVATNTFYGDFDIRIAFRNIDFAAGFNGNPRPTLCAFDTQIAFPGWGFNCDQGIAQQGFFYQMVRGAGFQAFIKEPGIFSYQVGASTQIASCENLNSSCWFRVTRIVNTWRFYYSLDGTSWTQDETAIVATVVNPLYAWFGTAEVTILDSIEEWFDNYTLESTLSAGGFRLEGQWDSPTFSSGLDEIYMIDFGFIGAAGGSPPCIERIDILISGTIVQSFVGCPIPPLIAQSGISGTNLSVNVLFTGDGNGGVSLGIVSVVMLSIDVPISSGTAWILLVILAALFIAFGLLGAGGWCLIVSAVMITGIGLIALGEPMPAGLGYFYPVLVFVSAVVVGIIGVGMSLEDR